MLKAVSKLNLFDSEFLAKAVSVLQSEKSFQLERFRRREWSTRGKLQTNWKMKISDFEQNFILVNNVVVRMVGIVRNGPIFFRWHCVLDCVVNDKRGKTVEKELESGDADLTSFYVFDPVSA